jgi:CDP-glycerol glycerophosphotransferase (TagB/SpsB family)
MSAHHRPILAAAFGVPVETVRVVGQPRHDLMHAADRSIWTAIGVDLARFRRVVLWMPTFRGQPRHREGGAETGVLLPPEGARSLEELLLEHDGLLVIKRHPYEPPAPALGVANVVDLGSRPAGGRWVGTYELLGAADVLVSDLSSAWIDFLVLDRPIVTYFPDLDEYARDRRLLLDPYEDWAPSPVARTWEELLAELADVLAGSDPHADRRRRLRDILVQNCEPGAAGRVLELLGIGPVSRGRASAR